ncbi:MAG: PepSY domain-containing protein, partial [Clostridiales bacterium]|nr:PepSY domain-containing protein [Clostridiales bacterium]
SVESKAAGTQSGSVISETAAKEAAFTHAGVSESSVSKLKVQLDTDDGVQIYEVEFRTSSAEYEYEINATTGDIISYEID